VDVSLIANRASKPEKKTLASNEQSEKKSPKGKPSKK
jgi:hypothetical protein